MTLTGKAREVRLAEVSDILRFRMEAEASRLKDIILRQPAHDLLAYLWSILQMNAMYDSEEPAAPGPDEQAERNQILATLEYAHAVWSCFPPIVDGTTAHLDEGQVSEAIELVGRLRTTALCHSIASSSGASGHFGEATGLIEFSAKSAWILIRGNRYQVLEEEFFKYVLAPHDAALREVYGLGSADVAAGVQAIATSMREGLNTAIETVQKHMDSTYQLADEQGLPLSEALSRARELDPTGFNDLGGAIEDMLRGGLCNLSRHTRLPTALLDDLAYSRGENSEFFSDGPFSGTPLRTLPARIRPLIHLADGYYATDGQFVRDSAYRALERGVTARLPSYRDEWNKRQKSLTESAFHDIFADQLRGSLVFREVYYKNAVTGHWTEADAVIVLDDVLLHVEAKAGIGVMHSPATLFESHVRVIQNLIAKAHEQATRFFEYLASADEVTLYAREGGQFVEVHRLALAGFRLAVPIGLTVESFTPFSAMCKVMPSITPLLGTYPFVSMSVDDLFVLNRFLPSSGELMHYLEVRQIVAGLRGGRLFDEVDHLGAYIAKNRFDITLRKQLAEAKAVTWDGFSGEIDRYFSRDHWLNESPPRQVFPAVLQQALDLLERSRTPGWLAVDATIRDLDDSGRADLATRLNELAGSLREYPRRWFLTSGDRVRTLVVWLFREDAPLPHHDVVRQGEIAALATDTENAHVLCLSVAPDGRLSSAQAFTVKRPPDVRGDLDALRLEAKALKARTSSISYNRDGANQHVGRTLGRNDPCWCGSGAKLKRCHGR